MLLLLLIVDLTCWLVLTVPSMLQWRKRLRQRLLKVNDCTNRNGYLMFICDACVVDVA